MVVTSFKVGYVSKGLYSNESTSKGSNEPKVIGNQKLYFVSKENDCNETNFQVFKHIEAIFW